ncbi:MAG: glycosyltransferase family 2 protein [Bacillus sp. (in: Bacteria)]|nr:glycosyltransferase family 2 protein [Bacillus sp. (in: firmicutes)]
MKVDILIPAYNEEDVLGETLKALESFKWIGKIIVIDDGSSDRTREVAAQFSCKLIHHHCNKGKMMAVMNGLKMIESDWVMLIDADLQESASEAWKLLEPLEKKRADMTVATINTNYKKGFGFVKRRARKIVFKETGVLLNSPLSGQRAFHKRWIPKITTSKGIGYGLELYLNLIFLSNGGIIEEVETKMTHRATGKDLKGFYHRAKQWMDMELTLWNYS